MSSVVQKDPLDLEERAQFNADFVSKCCFVYYAASSVVRNHLGAEKQVRISPPEYLESYLFFEM